MADDIAQRKLTTILAADVVAYSQQMAADEEATLARLRAWRAVTDALVGKHNGRVFSTAGDAFMAEFASAVEAVRCAISIQEDLAVRNAELAEDDQMWLMIGINVGDVMVEDGDLFGDGVNVAARLEGLAEKGGICISGSTFDQVKNKLSIAFDDIGAQRVKNIPEPVPAFRIVPGRVAVGADKTKTASGQPVRLFGLSLQQVMMASLALAAVALGGAHLAGLFPFQQTALHPHDGLWRVSVSELSGCRDNSPRSFVIRIDGGAIDEPLHPLPKTGRVSTAGAFELRATDQAGNLWNTQTATLTGERGTGRFQGRRPGCTGAVTLVRIE